MPVVVIGVTVTPEAGMAIPAGFAVEEYPKAVKMLREAYLMMQRMLCGNRTAFEGEFFKASRDLYFQYEIARRDVPVYIGTWGPKMAHMAAMKSFCACTLSAASAQ